MHAMMSLGVAYNFFLHAKDGIRDAQESRRLGDVYKKQIASLGLRVRKGCCFHGMSINVDMDLSPFDLINPCGYAGLRMTQLSECVTTQKIDYTEVEAVLVNLITSKLYG